MIDIKGSIEIVKINSTGYVAQLMNTNEGKRLKYLGTPRNFPLEPYETLGIFGNEQEQKQDLKDDILTLIMLRNNKVTQITLAHLQKAKKAKKPKSLTLKEKILEASPSELIALLKDQGVLPHE